MLRIGFVDWKGYPHCPIRGELMLSINAVRWEEDFVGSANGDRNSINTLSNVVLAGDQSLLQWLATASDTQRQGRYRSEDGGWNGTIYLTDIVGTEPDGSVLTSTSTPL
jgi:hypothetical protein